MGKSTIILKLTALFLDQYNQMQTGYVNLNKNIVFTTEKKYYEKIGFSKF